MNIKKLFVFATTLSLAAFFLSGCAGVPVRTAGVPTYNIGGQTYYPLVSLCESRNINWQYDTFSKTAILNKDSHRVNLMVGDTLVLVDGEPLYIKYPVDIHQGTIVVPYKFKEQVIDVLYRESYAPARVSAPISRIKKVVIDAGHGGNDPGAVGRTTGLREKDVNLDIAKRLSSLLRSQGVQVVMTRSTDNFVPLSRRVEIANNSGAELFISVHSNANRVRSLSGFEVYYVSPSVNDSQRSYNAARNAQLNLENASFASRSLDLKAILWDMFYTNSRCESIELARALCRAANSNLEAKILGVKGARFEVLKGVRMPAVLIEIGFLSNYEEERMLKNSYYRQKISQAIVEGIRDYAQDFKLMRVAQR